MNTFRAFFIENFPTFSEFILGFPLFLMWSGLSLYFAGYMKTRKGLKTGYTRKIFHLLIFTSATAIQTIWGLRTLCLFGAATSTIIFYAIIQGNGHLLYEAIAREKDAPHRTYYIVTPYLATFLGGVVSNVLFGEAALVGYLVTGLGDAIGEPVGTRFGKHQYRVPSLFARIPATRSYEGSLAVFFVSFLAALAACGISPDLGFPPHSWLLFPGVALCAACVEAISPHGWDNAAMQIIPSWYAMLFFLG